MKSIRIALIGCGGLGGLHCDAIQQVGGATLYAFADVFPKKAGDFCEKYGGKYATDDVEKIFRDDKIDAVYVCTLHDTHADFCIRAANAGKHVMVEKPLALTVEDCRRVGEAAERNRIKLMPAFKMRYYTMIQKARELIPQPLLVTMQMMDDRWPDTAWANDPIRGGGNVLSQGCHSCDILAFVANAEPERVFAEGGNFYTKTKVVDNVVATFRFANGCVGSWVQGDAHGSPFVSKFFMQIVAEGRSATLTHRMTKLTYSEAGKKDQVFDGIETGIVEENRAFIECIRNDTPPPINARDGLRATLMPLKAIESLRTGEPRRIWD